jgi:hypothetical protein
MKRTHILIAAMTGCLALPLASCTSTEPKTPVATVPELNLTAPLPTIAAAYVTTRTEVPHAESEKHHHEKHSREKKQAATVEWRYYREQNRVEVEDLKSETGELWLRDGNTQFFFKLFHADRRGIEYRMDDLQILQVTASWQQHALLIDPEVLQKLTLIEAGWRVDLNLPLEIKRSDAEHSETTRLQSVHPLDKSPWQRRDHGNYEMIDYADLGDRESDPFVIRVQSQLPGGDVHHH